MTFLLKSKFLPSNICKAFVRVPANSGFPIELTIKSTASRRALLVIACRICSQNLSGSGIRRGSAADAGSAKTKIATKAILTVPSILSSMDRAIPAAWNLEVPARPPAGGAAAGWVIASVDHRQVGGPNGVAHHLDASGVVGDICDAT